MIALARNLLRPDQRLRSTHYFTARIRDNGRNAAHQKRQITYLEALALQGVQSQFGHYLEKSRECRRRHSRWADYEEKMTDVNIAIQLLTDAFEDVFDFALVISGDSELKRWATGDVSIGEDKLRASQMPEILSKPDGFVLSRPANWR